MEAGDAGGVVVLGYSGDTRPCPAGHTVYQLNAAGLIELQDQTWSISGFTALAESFTPTPGVSTDIKQLLSA